MVSRSRLRRAIALCFAASALAALLLARSASADLTPYEGVAPPWLAQAQAYVNSLPPALRATDCAVGVGSQIPPGLLPAGRTGLYSQSPPIIWIKGPFVLSTFKHEYGHHAWYQVLTFGQQSDFNALWSAHRSALPSDYARTSVEEGFAECYRRKPANLKLPFRDYFQALWDGWS